jgi:lipoprotein NlpI
MKGDRDRAIADASEAVRLVPTFAMAYANRAGAYLLNGDIDLERAISDASEAIRLDPGYPLAYANRASAYVMKGDSDRAIADASEAIRLAGSAIAFFNRAAAYFSKGDNDRAIADYGEVIRLEPKSMRAYSGRGRANLYRGALSKALADFNQASVLDPKDAYAALWLEIAEQRNYLPSKLPEAIGQIDMTAWPAPVIQLFMDQLTPDAVQAAADNADTSTKRKWVCEANFYSGEFALRKAASADAIRLFRLAASNCPKDRIEWDAANAELKALGMRP